MRRRDVQEFQEFFKQRRRWMPSTLLNIADLIGDYKTVVYTNFNSAKIIFF